MKTLLLLLLTAIPAHAGGVDWSFPEANFTLCEGVGVHGSYRVTAHAQVEDVADAKRLTYFQVTVSSASAPDMMSATLDLTPPGGETERILLEKPWYPTLGPENAGPILVLPRIRTDEAGPSPKEMRTVDVPAGSTLVLTVHPSIKSCALGSATKTLEL